MDDRKRVLVVEDDEEIRRLIAIGLNKYGFEVRLASNGAEAIERFAELNPDVIILDIMMPMVDGWEVLNRINPTPAGTEVPIVVVTGRKRPTNGSVPSSVRAWLTKPVTIEQIANEVKKAFPEPNG